MVKARVCFSLTGQRKAIASELLKVQLNDENVKNIFQELLAKELGICQIIVHNDVDWHDIQTVVKASVISASGCNQMVKKSSSV